MWVRLVTVYVDPERVEEIREFYNSPDVSGVIAAQQGHRFHYLLESVGGLGEFISLTAWDTESDASRYDEKGTFLKLINKFRPWFTQAPELRSYLVEE